MQDKLETKFFKGAVPAKECIQCRYDADGNVLYENNLVTTNASFLYTYDGLNRITSYQQGELNGNQSAITSGTLINSGDYTMDALGNVTAETNEGSSYTNGINNQSEFTNVGGTTTTYDANGNMTDDYNSFGYTFDAWNHVIKVGTTYEQFSYNADGQRITQTTNPGGTGEYATNFYYSASDQDIEDTSGSSGTTNLDRYVWGIDYVNDIVMRASGSGLATITYALHDANYDVTGLASSGGAITTEFSYDPYGNVLTGMGGDFASADPTTWAYLFQGGRMDALTQLYWFENRDYDPVAGTWREQDPASAAYVDGMNLYKSFDDNGVTFADPSGNYSWAQFGNTLYYLPIETGRTVAGMYNGGVDHTSQIMARTLEMGGSSGSAIFDGTAHLLGAGTGAEDIAQAIMGVDNVSGCDLSTSDRWEEAGIGTLQLGLTFAAFGGSASACFVAGTPVLIAEGSSVALAQGNVGTVTNTAKLQSNPFWKNSLVIIGGVLLAASSVAALQGIRRRKLASSNSICGPIRSEQTSELDSEEEWDGVGRRLMGLA